MNTHMSTFRASPCLAKSEARLEKGVPNTIKAPTYHHQQHLASGRKMRFTRIFCACICLS